MQPSRETFSDENPVSAIQRYPVGGAEVEELSRLVGENAVELPVPAEDLDHVQPRIGDKNLSPAADSHSLGTAETPRTLGEAAEGQQELARRAKDRLPDADGLAAQYG